MMEPPVGRRERKAAETRLALLDAALARLDERTLDEISVRELCDEVDISEPTFFNHFASKGDLLVYLVELWSLEMAWHVREAEHLGARAAIETLFRATAAQITPHPRVMAEVIAHQVRRTRPPTLRDITRAERMLRFPNLAGIEAVEAKGFESLVLPLIGRAIAVGELPRGVDPLAALLALASVFFGVPLILGGTDPAAIEGAYLQQLDVTWRGLTAAFGGSGDVR